MAALTPQYPSTHDSIRIHKGNYGDVKFSVYYPATSLDSPLPVGVYYHPGGLAVGPSIADEYFCAAVANYNNTVVVAVEYRLSTEFRAPVYLDDALDGLTWVSQS